MIDTCNSLSPIFLNFKRIDVLTDKKLKLPFRKTKLGIQAYPMWDLILGIAFPII